MDRRTFVLGSLLGATALGNALMLSGVFGKKRRISSLEQTEVEEGICSLSFSLFGDQLVTANENGVLAFWEPSTGKMLSEVPARHGFKVNSIAFLSRDSWLATADEGSDFIKFWRPGESREKTYIRLQSHPTCIEFLPQWSQGTTPPPGVAVVGLADNSICALHNDSLSKMLTGNSFSFAELAKMEGHTGRINAFAFGRVSPLRGLRLASASDDRTVRIWSNPSWKSEAVLRGFNSAVKSVAFSKDGSKLATVCSDGTLTIWQMDRFSKIAEINAGSAIKARFTADPNFIVSISSDHTTKVWCLRDGLQMGLELPQSPGLNPLMDCSAEGEYLASAWGDGIKFWRTADLIASAKKNLKMS